MGIAKERLVQAGSEATRTKSEVIRLGEFRGGLIPLGACMRYLLGQLAHRPHVLRSTRQRHKGLSTCNSPRDTSSPTKARNLSRRSNLPIQHSGCHSRSVQPLVPIQRGGSPPSQRTRQQPTVTASSGRASTSSSRRRAGSRRTRSAR